MEIAKILKEIKEKCELCKECEPCCTANLLKKCIEHDRLAFNHQ